MIFDDGKEINKNEKTQANTASLARGTHLGLRGMKSRAELLGAKLTVNSDSETGTQIKLVVPV